MRITLKASLVLALLVAALTWGLASQCAKPPNDGDAWADSLAKVQRAADARIQAAKDSADQALRAAALQSDKAAIAKRAADRRVRWADSVLAAGGIPDTGVVPRPVYDSLRSAYTELGEAHEALGAAYRGALEAAATLRAGLDSAGAAQGRERLAYEERIKVLERRAKGCRVMGLLPCPVVTPGIGAVVEGGTVHAGLGAVVGFPIRL